MNTLRKPTSLGVLTCFVLGILLHGTPYSVHAQNSDLEEAIKEADQSVQDSSIKEIASDIEFESFSSCEDMSTVLEEFLEENKDSFQQRYYPRPWDDMMVFEEEMIEDVAADSVAVESVGAPMAKTTASADMAQGGTVQSSSTDVSTTNIQVEGIDEPDILKTNGDHLFYYNTKLRKLSIIQSPLDRDASTIDLDDAEIITEIEVPKDFSGMQLFLYKSKLVMMGQRWRNSSQKNYETFIDTSARTDIIVYDISDIENPQLDRFTDLDGSYLDGRLIDNELYIVSQLSVNRWDLYRYYDENEEIVVDDLLPTVRDISYKREGDAPLVIEGKEYPYGVATEKPGCNEILYVLPTSDSLKNTNIYPSFTVVRKVEVDDSTSDVETTTAFGTAQTIHMSQDSLYLVDQIYSQNKFSCPSTARCIMPWFWGGQSNTLIHKFERERGTLKYGASTVVPGMPLTQYSMSEDASGDFRILTKQFQPQLATDLYILDGDLQLKGSLTGIEKGEEFKSSRYIGNKLYLVTFERTDPLFVIDLDDERNPEIIGELKIPGYSTYLHPYGPEKNGIQRLIGLGYDTKENQRGGIVTNGVKVDLYTVDYAQKDEKGNVLVEQTYTETYGKKGSWSEAVENPRMVVWDETRELLVVPMILQDEEVGKNCSIQYDGEGNEIGRNCRDTETYFTTFAGMKGLNIDVDNGISQEFSYDYTDMLKKDESTYRSWNGEIYSWQFRQSNFRVGYLGDAMYALNTLFGHFVIPDKDLETFVEFE